MNMSQYQFDIRGRKEWIGRLFGYTEDKTRIFGARALIQCYNKTRTVIVLRKNVLLIVVLRRKE